MITPAISSAPRILIVEDQYLVAVDCELHLRAAGFECIGFVTTAAESLELAERERPDLVLMDIRLASRADGVQAAIVLKERLGIRCVFASGHADATVRRQAERAQPLGWLDKPFSGDELVKVALRAVAELQSAPAAGVSAGRLSGAVH